MSMPVLIPDIDDDSMSQCSFQGDVLAPQHSFYDQSSALASVNVMLRRDREREGRCAECGIHTHDVRTDSSIGTSVKVPLSIEKEVHRGRCLFCFPLKTGGSRTQGDQMFTSSTDLSSKCVATIQTDAFDSAHEISRDHTFNMRGRPTDVFDILYTMRLHPYVEGVQQRGCEALWVQSWEDESASAIGRIGGIPLILDAMFHFPSNSALQRSACETLQNLALNSYNRSIIVDLGGASLVVQAMMRHLDSAAIQQCGCMALASLASSQDLWQDIIAGGAGHAIIHSARNFANDKSILFAASEALKALGCEDPGRYIPQPCEN